MSKHQSSRVQTLAIPNYTLLNQIGEGGHGLVYKAEQISTGQLVAIKMLKLQGISDPQKRKQQLARFERETSLCAKINHHNIVRLIDKGFTAEEEPYAVFEFVTGTTLKQYITGQQGLSALETQQLMMQVLDALISAHNNGVIHRDLKPQNIMVTNIGARPHIKILDFGIGTFTQDFRASDYQTLTLTQEFLGTPNYSAPEQLRGEPPTEKSDLYAWGLIMVECLTGKPVIKGKSIAEVFQQQLRPANVTIPPAILAHPIGDLLRRVLDKNPQRRIASAQIILEEISAINFSTLIGNIRVAAGEQDYEEEEDDVTVVNTLLSRSASAVRKQITVVGIKLNLISSRRNNLDLETLDAVEKDQLNLCKDIAIKYGGYIAGTISNHILVYFGYPEVDDTDARRAGRTALELITEARKRSALLEEAHGIRIELRTSLHSGTVLILPNQVPEGNVPNTAFELLYQAKVGSALASTASKKLLEPFLDFEFAKETVLPNGHDVTETYHLVGERQSEALSALKSWSTKRELIGREKEQKNLNSYWEKANHELQKVLLHGQAGIGKSRLTYELKKEVQTQGFLFRECRCLPEHQNNALHPFLSMLKKHWGIAKSDNQTLDSQKVKSILERGNLSIEDALPVLCSWLTLPLPEGVEASQKTPDEQKQVLFNTLKACIAQIDSEKRHLLVVEDFHWIDPTSKEFINFLIEEAKDKKFLLLITSRPIEEDYPKSIPQIHLEPLPKSAMELMIQSVLGHQKVQNKAVQYIIDRTDGVPLFVEELTSMLLEQNYLIQKDKVYELVADIEDKAIPITLQALLNAKLERLGFAKETAQLAAAIGREFNYDLLVKASVKDEAMVQGDLNQLIQYDLIFRQRRVNEDRYLFRHALIGDAAYSGMTNSRQKEVHFKLAETLESYFPEQVDQQPFGLARHWAGAQQFSKATDYGIATVQKLVASSSNQEALGVNEEVQKWLNQMDDGAEKFKRELSLNEGMLPVFTLTEGWASEVLEHLIKRNNELITSLQASTQDLSEVEIGESLAKSEWILFANCFNRMEYDKTLELGNMILQRLEQKEDHQYKMVVSAFMGQAHLNIGNFDLAKSYLNTVIEEGTLKGDLSICSVYGFDPCVHACGVMALVQYMFGYPDKGIEYAKKGIRYAKQVDHMMPLATAYVFASLIYAVLNNRSESKCLLDEIFNDYQDKLVNTPYESVLFLVLDWINKSTERSAQILQAFIDAKQNNSAYWYEYLLIETLINKEEYDLAKSWILGCIGRSDIYFEPVLLRLQAIVLAKLEGMSNQVEKLFEQSIHKAKSQKTKWLELHSLVEFYSFFEGYSKKKDELLDRMTLLTNQITEGQEQELYLKAKSLIREKRNSISHTK